MSETNLLGHCRFCREPVPVAHAEQHVQECDAWAQHLNRRSKRRKPERLFWLLVQGYHLPQYWMLIEVPAALTLLQLDQFFRKAWLECCGHMSAFMIGDDTYGVLAHPELNHEPMDKAKLRDVVSVGDWFGYDYDFGDTTTLMMGVVHEREGVRFSQPVIGLMRNEPETFKCACGEPAELVCGMCLHDPDQHAWVCEACAADDVCPQCEEESLLPITDSPRVGVCGYAGPSGGVEV